jgi:hypothetical protein
MFVMQNNLLSFTRIHFLVLVTSSFLLFLTAPKAVAKETAPKSAAPTATTAACKPRESSRDKVRHPKGKQPVNLLCDPLRPQAADYRIVRESIQVPDRWRIVDSLPGYDENLFDPYNRNILKGDKPLFGDWFFSFSGIADSVYEARSLPTPVGIQSSNNPSALDVFGSGKQSTFNENIILEFVFLKGDTIFRPPDLEFRFIPVINFNRSEVDEKRALRINPSAELTRSNSHLGIQGAFVDYHLRNVSVRYDFDSLRVGIQPFNTDFRGFLFQDNQMGVRLFGTRDNNIYQYNIAWFRRLEKDINSGLNDVTKSPRKDDILVANLYRQDFPVLGFTSQATILYNRNRENESFFDANGFIQRPFSLGSERSREYDVTYLGLNGDGHFDRLGVSVSSYVALGENKNGIFSDKKSTIEAFFFAAELSMDFDWKRIRASFVYASGDGDPFDDKETGYDAVFENPQIAGSDTSFWIRQGVPLVAGGGVTLSTRNGMLNNLNSSKEHGQSNFTNPGLLLLGIGSDLDLTPTLRISANINHLWFDKTAALEVARNQGNIDKDIGWDISAALIWRPYASQNIVARFSAATLISGKGYEDLYEANNPYSILANIIFSY